MTLDIENQIKEIHAVLDEFRHKLKLSDHVFTTSIVPKPKVLEEEFCLIDRLIRYEKPALVFTANEIECNSKSTYHSKKKNSLSLLRCINISLLTIVTFVFTAIILYREHKFSIYTLIGFWIVFLFTVFLIIAKILSVISESKNRHCIYLVRQAIELKEKNISGKELQQLFGSAKDLMTEVRDQKIKGEKLISLLEKVVRQKERNK